MKRVISFGKSMYGGWYINFEENGIPNGVHGTTLKECIMKAQVAKSELKSFRRADN